MFAQSFPDLAWLKTQAESRFSNRRDWNNAQLKHTGWPTVILNVKAGETYRDNIPGPLSFFSTLSGKSRVEVNGKKTIVPSSCFLLTNPGERYTLEIVKKEPAETFNIHFSEHWAEEVWAGLQKTETVLDNPELAKAHRISFHHKLYVKTPAILHVMDQLKKTRNEGALKRDELLYQLMIVFLTNQNEIKQSAMTLPVLKKSTREEIASRLFLAADFIYAFHEQNLSLEQLANISCLSKFHFLRLFKQFFGKTPHQFVTEVRIQRSKELIKAQNQEIKSVAASLGFDSASSFSRLFRQHVGVYPREFQNQVTAG